MLNVQSQGAVRTLQLHRPEVRNALNAELQGSLLHALDEAEADATVRALVITGSGKAFCAGLDLADLKAISRNSAEENRRDSARFARLLERLYTFPKPTVAALNGHAVAGGAGLASACDLVVMSEGAKLGYTEVKIGFVPAVVAVLLLRQLGERQARDLLLTGRLISAGEAHAFGLVNDVVKESEVMPRALELAALTAKNSPTSLELTKTLLCALPGMGLFEALRYAVDLNTLARGTADLQEGVGAFLEKRDPSWQR
ncbi:MAG: enoyl-CoA hydratase-related protein [Deinococcota bacterium]|jgi:methylglutaconyl-CoA hydratase|nr:enoyl-CoA hydratase-related protein [Deinococcota bacterium]